ncbi:MAG: STAS domain-containing protein, partial [Roseiflexaceae bacterium]
TQQLVAASADRSAAAVQRAVAAIHQLHVDTEELRNETDTVMGRDVAAVTDTVATRTTTTFYGIAGQLGIFVLLAFVMLLLLRRHIMQPITALSAAASAVAQGSLDQVVRVTSRDEIGTLQQAFNDMTVELRQKTQDLERQVAAATTAQIAAETARTATSEQLATIEEQRTVIREMSVPILPLTTTAVVMPLVGVLDSARLQTVQERVLQTLAQTATRHMILDITGVPLVDSQVAQGLLRVIQSARLLGTEVVIVGVRPEVAQTIVGLGIDLNGTVTRSTLQGGIDYALHGH